MNEVAMIALTQGSLIRGGRLPLNRNRRSLVGVIQSVSRPLPISTGRSNEKAMLLLARKSVRMATFRCASARSSISTV